MIALPQADDFWNINKQRERAQQDLKNRLDYTRNAMATAGRVSSIQSHPGFPAFKKAVEGMRASRIQALIMSVGSEAELRRLQGAVHELGAIIAIMERAGDSEKKLAATAQTLEDQLSKIVEAVPKKEKGNE